MATVKSFLTTEEAIRYLRTSRPTLWRLEKEGKLKPYRIGASLRWDLEELDRAVRSGALGQRRKSRKSRVDEVHVERPDVDAVESS
ncbi:helix-turn-helix transcriptional regulator [Candidatus Methylacidithermus pantelleriae]|uniref:Helix-turn-helix domain-containing protein n=1 Tax=Candidatus Methylacidithermus pantelleriae TaxID=2744239 RepID=A0A8J2FS25_9BACT|nr:helix-turn-helix domain-containing protein [Candidatus Methylacidithermus pantelleriae]CAF0700573.1 hypothetical protein MPNT_380017 [Candidatus Methylacidithermus pantelleriae]